MACAVAARHVRLADRTVAATVAMAVMPDILPALPALTSAVTGEGMDDLVNLVHLALAHPVGGPTAPPSVAWIAHHLHCGLHSVLVLGLVTLLAWLPRGGFWWPLAGWWSHILIDVPTHSTEFYPVPVLYPITYWGLDGLAWNTRWFLALNYAALITLGAWLWHTRRR